MRHRSRSSLVALTLALVLALAVPSNAMGALEDEPATQSTTNPNIGKDATWRWSWGNSWFPDMIVTSVPADGTEEDRRETLGFLYEINQLPVDPSLAWDVIMLESNVPTWTTSLLSPRPEGSTLTGLYDFKSHVSGPAGWTQYPGATMPGEGVYALSFLFYNQFRVEDPASLNVRFRGLDFTRPRPVVGLSADRMGTPATANGWTETRRRNLKWDGATVYDDLAGVGGFAVSLDGKDRIFAQNRAPQIGFEPYAALLNPGDADARGQLDHVTIEDLPAGASSLGVTVVDRATNRSTTSTVKALVDFDTPKIAISSPSSGGYVPSKSTFKASATDAAGITQVRYYVDGVFLGASTKSPFSLSADLSSFSNGTHTLKAVAYDQIGGVAPSSGSWKVPHTATATRSFKIDKTAPTVSSVSGAPNPFFPRKRDGYKDNFKVKFRASEPGTAKLTIRNSKGTVVRTVTKSVAAGANSISWDGRSTGGSVKSGTFSWKLTLTDRAGNAGSASTRKVSIKFYELVKTASNSLRVIER